MRGSLFFSAATAALLMLAPGAAAQDSDPPGDASTPAQFTGAPLEGELSAGDVDWYRMRVEQGQRYQFTLDAIDSGGGRGVDPVLTIYDAQGNQLAFNDDANGLNSALRFAPRESGEVFVEARAYGSDQTGRYRLAASASTVPVDAVGNDTTSRARASLDQPIAGQLEYEGDVDVYRFAARRGQRYHITLDAADSDDPLYDPLLRVVGRDSAELAMNDDGENGLNSSLDFTPETSGDVFIEARSYADVYSGAYRLNITRAPNDNLGADRNTRGRIAFGQSVDGVLDFTGDRDWYRVRLEGGHSYRFTLNSAGDNALRDPFLSLHGPNGQELASDDDGGGGLNAYLEFTAPATGNYFVDAGAFADSGTGGYTLTARQGDIPADASTDAALSISGDWRAGRLSPAGDRDWYRIDANEGQSFRVSLENTMSPDGLSDPYLILYGPDGAEVTRDDDGGDGLNALLEYQATQTGAYYIEARGFSDGAEGAYYINVLAGEIGNSIDTADYLSPSEGRTSSIGADGDADWFMVEMIEGRPYRFNLIGLEEGGLADPVLTLYDPNGQQVAYDDDGGTGFNSYLTFMTPTGGPYFAAVTSFGNTGTGRYWLGVSDMDVPGHAATDENLDSANDDRLSRIDMNGDLDNYRVELEAGRTYVINVAGQGEDPLADPFLAVLNESGERVASDDDSGPGLDARLRFTPERSGVYYLQASGLGGSIGWYQISIVRQ